uniref:Uncharacterized protein n=1 Tax=Anguilla anguilla TaxID=7936 RepID=A0A0E9XFJ5_ANGAN
MMVSITPVYGVGFQKWGIKLDCALPCVKRTCFFRIITGFIFCHLINNWIIFWEVDWNSFHSLQSKKKEKLTNGYLYCQFYCCGLFCYPLGDCIWNIYFKIIIKMTFYIKTLYKQTTLSLVNKDNSELL